MAKKKSMTSATSGYDRLKALQALASRLAAEIDGCDDARSLPGLAKQYRECMAEIDTIQGGMDDDTEIASIILRNRKSAPDK